MVKSKETVRIVSSHMSISIPSEDAIEPSEFRHEVDEIYDGDQLQECYNYIEYDFEQDDAYCRARTYLDTIDEVAIYGPFAGRGDHRTASAPEFRNAVLAYLKRRFNEIKQLGDHGYETTWKRSRK